MDGCNRDCGADIIRAVGAVFSSKQQEAVVAMTQAGSSRGSEFNDFLFASIGEDKNGMPLSVLSALARLDVDPWQEAAALAKLPGGAAAQRLASLIAALPNEPSAHLGSGPIAARLVALLARAASAHDTSTNQASGDRSTPIFRTAIYMLFIVFLLGTEIIVASHQVTAQVAPVHPPVASAVSGKMPTTPLDH